MKTKLQKHIEAGTVDQFRARQAASRASAAAQALKPKLITYTVIGIYKSTKQRYCTSVEAMNPTEAQEIARCEIGAEMLIAGVIEGRHSCVDSETYAYE